MQDWDSIHLEGMGWLGSLIAHELTLREIPFTWNELLPADGWIPTAWQASSGLIYPSGDVQSIDGYRLWERVHACGHMLPYLSRSEFWYTTKAHPNGLRTAPVSTHGPFNQSPFPAFSVDVAKFVRFSRELHWNSRTSTVRKGPRVQLIKAHSHPVRWAWGWTAPAIVMFAGLPSMVPAATFYMRANKYQLFYAVYRHGGPAHVIGSAHIGQQKPKAYTPDEVFRKVMDFQTKVEAISEGMLKIALTGAPVQGWRPMGNETDPRPGVYDDGVMLMPAMGSSGVRHALPLLQNVMAALGCESTLKICEPTDFITPLS